MSATTGTAHVRWAARILAVLSIALVCLSSPPVVAEPPFRPSDTGTPARMVPGSLRVVSPYRSAGTVVLSWEGSIAAPMAEQMEAAIAAFASSRRRFVLAMNSGGGSVSEGEKVIALLRRLKTTHLLDTVVGQGSRCGSMCVPIYLQGQNRVAGKSSSWLFHEVTRPGSQYGRLKRVSDSDRILIEKYWIPAGVSRDWVQRMRVEADNHDWWQTGNDLINDKAGIITRAIDNRRARNLETDPTAPSVPAAEVAKPAAAPARRRTLPTAQSRNDPEAPSSTSATPGQVQDARPAGGAVDSIGTVQRRPAGRD